MIVEGKAVAIDTKEKFVKRLKRAQALSKTKSAYKLNQIKRQIEENKRRKQLHAEIDARRGSGLLLQDLQPLGFNAENPPPLSEEVLASNEVNFGPVDYVDPNQMQLPIEQESPNDESVSVVE